MKKIKLNQSYETLIDNKYYSILNKYKWFIGIDSKQNINSGVRRSISKNNKKHTIYIHRIIMELEGHNIRNKVIDHIDGNPLNNQINNLRLATRHENNMNLKLRKNSKTGYKGVIYISKSKKWRARISFNYKTIHLGCFSNKIDAIKAYNIAAMKYFGEFARLNII